MRVGQGQTLECPTGPVDLEGLAPGPVTDRAGRFAAIKVKDIKVREV